MKDGADARTQLDLTLVKATEPAHDPSAKALLARIERLEGRTPPPPPPRDPAEPATAAGRTRVAVAAAATPPAPDTPEPTAVAVAVVDADGSELSLEAFAAMWPAVVESLGSESPRLAAILQEARPTALADQDLTIAWPESAAFSKRQAEDPEKRELIAQSIRAVTGVTLRLAYELGGEHEPAPTLSEDELVARFKQEFGAVEESPPTEEES
jgi:DNA polymerase-3 subunit gamma/tau